MFSMDFEEFLWAKGYQPKQVEDMYRHMVELKPFSQLEMDTIMDVFRNYMSLGGMPEVVKMYIDNGHFGGTGRPACQQELRYLQGGNIRKHCR